ncbi:MAG: hypothetical protein LBB10_00855, partial [Bifidobacteriaceae bacterium]|nr:hypothetical protein [Bifidobacteriaceae bacterium]
MKKDNKIQKDTKRHFWTKNKKIAASLSAIAVAFGGSVAFYKINEYNGAVRDFQDANARIVQAKESLKSTDSDLNKALKYKDAQVKDKKVLKTLKDTNKKAQEVLNVPVEDMKSSLDEIRGQTTQLNALADTYQVAADALRDQIGVVHKSRFDKSKDNLVSLIKTANDLKEQDHSQVIDQAKVENLKKEIENSNKIITAVKVIFDNYFTHADSVDKSHSALKKAIDELNS